jgi:hypothetical protein
MTKIVLCIAAGLMVLGFNGCTIDTLTIMDHPDSVKPASSLDAQILGTFVVMMPGKTTLPSTISRDSIHLGFGLPTGWSVESASFYYSPTINMKTAESTIALSQPIDSAAMEVLKRDSLAAFIAKSTPLTLTSLQNDFFAGKSLPMNTGESITSDSIDWLACDSIDQWFMYTGKVGISISKFDTVIINNGTIPDTSFALPISIDTVGASVAPIFFFVKLKAPSAEGDYPLYYYIKTGSLPKSIPTQAQLTSQLTTYMLSYQMGLNGQNPADIGTILNAKVRVSLSAAVKYGQSTGARNLGYRMNSNFTRHTTRFTFDKAAPGQKVEMYTLNGVSVGTYSANNGTIEWNWGEADNGTISSGTYIARITNGNANTIVTVPVSR